MTDNKLLTIIALCAIISAKAGCMNAKNIFGVVMDDGAAFRARLKKLVIMISAAKGEAISQGEVLKMGLDALEKVYLK